MYSKILVPLDGSELAECVFPHVKTISGGCGVQNLVFLRVVEPFYISSGYNGVSLSAEQISRINSDNLVSAGDYLKALVERTELPGTNIQTEVITGKAAESIVDYAEKNSIDLIIIATHGRSGISRWVFGSVADRVLRHSCIPVLMVRAPGCVPGI